MRYAIGARDSAPDPTQTVHQLTSKHETLRLKIFVYAILFTFRT